LEKSDPNYDSDCYTQAKDNQPLEDDECLLIIPESIDSAEMDEKFKI
jgi:hypothetical protein